MPSVGAPPPLRPTNEGFPPIERHEEAPAPKKTRASRFPKPKPVAAVGVEGLLFEFFNFLNDVGVHVVASGQRLIAILVALAAAWFAPDEWAARIKDNWEDWRS